MADEDDNVTSRFADILDSARVKAGEMAFKAVWNAADFVMDPKGFMQLRAEERQAKRDRERHRKEAVQRHKRVLAWRERGEFSHSGVLPYSDGAHSVEEPEEPETPEEPRGLLAKALKIRGETIGEMVASKPKGLLARAIAARESMLPPNLADDIAVSPEDEQFPYAEEPELEEPFPDDVSEPRNSLFTMFKAGVRRIPSDLKRVATPDNIEGALLAPGRKFVDGVIRTGEAGRAAAGRIGEFASARGRAVRDFVKGVPGSARGLIERAQTARRNARYYYSPENIARRERGEERRARMQEVWRNLRVSAERARLDITGGAMNARYNAAERIRGLFHRGGGSPVDEAPVEGAPAEDAPPEPPPAPPAEPELTTNSQKVGEGVAYTLGNGKDYNVPSQNFDKTFAHMQRGIQSSLREGDYIGASNKYSTGGRNFERTLFTRRAADRRAESAIETALSLMNGAADEEGNIDPEREVSFQKEGTSIYRGKENFYGRAAKDELKRSLAKNGGRIVGVNGDEVEYEYAMLNSTADSYAAEGKSAPAEFEAKAFKRARELSGAQKQKDDEKQQKQKEAEDKKAEGKKSAERAASQKAAGKAILAAIALVADLVRRILTSMLKDMEQRRQDGLDGRKLGETAREVRNYRNSERTMGVREGTVMAAIQSIQDNFGDVRHYNTQKFEEVAPWAEDVLRPLIDTGITHQKPRVALAAILDRAMERVKSGVDSIGNRVGEEAAYRSIMSSLERFDPNAAELFQNMYDTNTYGIYEGRANTFEEWLKVGGISTAENSADVAKYEELTQATQSLIAAFNRLKDDAILKLALALEGLINWAKDLDLGASPTEKVDNKLTKRELALQKIEEYRAMQGQAASMTGALAEARGLDFSEVGAEDADDFLERYRTAPKVRRAVEESSRWRALVNSGDFKTASAYYEVANESETGLQKMVDKAARKKNIKYIKFNETEHTDVGVSERVKNLLEREAYTEYLIEHPDAAPFTPGPNEWYPSVGNYNDFITSEAARKLGLDEAYGGKIDSLERLLEVGELPGLKLNGEVNNTLRRISQNIEMSDGTKAEIPLERGDDNVTIVRKINEFLAQHGGAVDENLILENAGAIIDAIYQDMGSNGKWSMGDYNNVATADTLQKFYHLNALSRSDTSAYIQNAQKMLNDMHLTSSDYNLMVHSYAKSENEIVFKLKAHLKNGEEIDIGEWSATPTSTGLETGKSYTVDLDEKVEFENVE